MKRSRLIASYDVAFKYKSRPASAFAASTLSLPPKAIPAWFSMNVSRASSRDVPALMIADIAIVPSI